MITVNDTFPERLLFARKEKLLTQSQLANMVRITQRQIAAYEAGKAKPREKTLLDLAFYLDVPPLWLAQNDTRSDDAINMEFPSYTPTAQVSLIPIYDFKEFDITLINKPLSPHDNKLIPLPEKINNYYKNIFAIRIEGDSMTPSSGIGLYDGSIMTFDPNAKIKSGDICLIDVDGYYTIRKLFIDADQTTARTLNPNYADLILKKGEYKIIAKAVHAAFTF